MADIYVKSGGGTQNSGTYRGIWLTAGNWAVGDRVIAVNLVSYRIHECTTAGAGDAAEPTWNTSTGGTTTMVAGAVFTTRIPDTWANATIDLARAATNDIAGDTIYLSQAHAESTAAALTFALAGTLASPVKAIAVSDSAAPPTAESTASITATGANAITFSGAYYYVKNITFNVGTTAANASMNCNSSSGGVATFEDCTFSLLATSTGSRVNPASGSIAQTTFKDCWVKFSNAAHAIAPSTLTIDFTWRGGGLASGGTSPTTFWATQSGVIKQIVLFDGLDLSAASAGMNIFGAMTGVSPSTFVIRNSKLPASWSGALVTGTIGGLSSYEMYNCDSGDTNYRFLIERYQGSIRNEQTIVRTGGASDGTTAMAWKMATSANAKFPSLPLESQEIVIWNDTVGSAVTAKVEIVHDSQGAGLGSKFQDDEIWLQVNYLGTTGFPLGTFASDVLADLQTAAANQADSTETWTTTGLASPVKQKLTVTFTPQEKGYVSARVMMAKASKTAYICPKLAVA